MPGRYVVRLEIGGTGDSKNPGQSKIPFYGDVSLPIYEKKITAIIGPSGCGKSTLLNMIGLLDDPSEGELRVDGRKINGQGDRGLAAAGRAIPGE